MSGKKTGAVEKDSAGLYRGVVLGTGGVGKSALVFRYISDNFVAEYDPTIENTFRKTISLEEGDGKESTARTFEVVDTAGQEDFRSLLDAWIRRGHGFLVVYSITSRNSFERTREFHDTILSIKEDDAVPPVILVGNKCDLEGERKVSTEEGKARAAEWGWKFFETSAKSKTNVIQLFETLVKDIHKNTVKQVAKDPGRKPGICTLL